MEESQSFKSKKKIKKNKLRSTTNGESSKSYQYEGKLSNLDTTADLNEDILNFSDGFSGPSSLEFHTLHDANSILTMREYDEIIEQTNADDIVDDESKITFNNLDLPIGRGDDLLRKSQLNVFECNQELPILEKDIMIEDEFTPKQQNIVDGEYETQAEVDQLYPSLDEEFYQDLQEKSTIMNRSLSRISCYNFEDLDTLSMQTAEAQLNNIENYLNDETYINANELTSFEVVHVIDGEACIDNQSIISENTVHHLSLHTPTFDNNFEGKFQKGYQSNCVSPSISLPNFEELNKEILVNELKVYYHNPQLSSNEEFLEDFFSVCDNLNHEFCLLLQRYQTARQSYLLHNTAIEASIAKCSRTQEIIWTFPKDKKIEYGYCADHIKVSYSENCTKSQCHHEALKEMNDNLNAVHDACNVPLALLQYNWKIDFYHVEQYLVKLVDSCPPLYNITEMVTSYVPGVLIPWDHINQTTQLRICISILFYFKRQKSTDEVFAQDVDRWLKILIGLLLRVATLLDHRFILNHLLRCPTAFSFWGSSYLQLVWSDATFNTETIIGNPIIDHFLLMYLTLISPLTRRDNMLINYEPPKQDSDPSEWALLDELGEVSCDEKQLLERDYLQLLGQFDFGMFYRELLKFQTPDEFIINKDKINEREIMTLLSMCLKCISFIKESYSHLDFTRYRNFCQRNAKIMTTFVRFVSDYYYFYEGYGGKYERYTENHDVSKLRTLHDHVFQEGFRCLADTSNVSLWQFLVDLPYHRVSIKVLWKLYGFLHQVNPDKHIKSCILKDGTPYDIITKLYRTARFQKRLDSLSDEDCTFMINVFCKMAASRESLADDNFIKVVGLDIYHIGVTASIDKQSTDRSCKNGLSGIIDHCPEVVSVIINNIEKPTLKDLPSNLKIFRGLSLLSWQPSDDDLILLTNWLQSTSITSLTNQLSRIVIKGMNWGSHNNQLFIPCQVHRKMAVTIVSAHSYHMPDRPGYLIHSSTPDFAKHVSNSDKNVFVKWCWDVLLMLCLHKTDLLEHDAVTQKLTKQRNRQLRRQKSETIGGTSPPTKPLSRINTSPTLSSTPNSSSNQPRQNSTTSRSDSGSESESIFVGKWGKFPYKMRKETNLSTLCEALRTGGEMASFVALSVTSIGHTIIDFQADGIQLIQILQKNSQHRAILQILTNLFAITLRNKCLHLLIQLPEFIPLVLNIAKTEYSNSLVPGKTCYPFTGYILNKLVSGYKNSIDDGNLCMRFWLQLFFAIPNFHSEPSVVVILDKMFRAVFRYDGDEEYLEQQLRTYLVRVVENSKHNSSKIMTIMSWFSNNSYVTSLIQHLTNPGEVFWWSYYVTKMECKPQKTSQFFQILTEVLLTNPELTIDYAVRRTHTLLANEEVANVGVANVAIYRWSSLLQSVPMDHPLLPYAWQEFFKLYFYRPVPDGPGVGYRFYQGMFYAREIRSMKQRLLEIAKHFELDEDEDEITDSMLFGSKLSHFFQSLSLWADETRLHEANLFVPGLPQQYNGDKLSDIIQGKEGGWEDMINTAAIDDTISADIAEWYKYTARKYSPRVSRTVEETATYLVDQLYQFVRQNMAETEPPPELIIPQSHIPPLPTVPNQDSLSLISLVGPYFGKLKNKAEKFVELSNKVESLNKSYIEEMPTMYSNRNTQRTELVPCYSRMGPIGRCNGPALLTITSTTFHENAPSIEAVNSNRALYEQVLAECRKDLDNDVCITAMFVENIVSELYKTHQDHRDLGKQLFYHVVENLTEAVWRYPPSQQIFAFSIDCLGQFFIRNNPEETLPLLNKILTRTEFATVLAPLFQPNQGYDRFVEIYTHVIQSVSRCEIDVGFTILSKFDLRSWLTTSYATIEQCKQLLDTIFLGFDIYRYNADDTNFLMFYDTLKLHLRHILSNRLSGLLQYSIEKTLDISQKFPHHQQIWSEIVDILEMDHSQQWITLSTCHKVLYEISKYFLQYKKSILKSEQPDLYSDWSCYIDCIINLYNTLCTTYITKAAYLDSFSGHQQTPDINPPIDGNMQKPIPMVSEEQTACIFTMTCSVFGPWILVFEESCLPWSEANIAEADKVLNLFCEMLMLINNEIDDSIPLLCRLWWYYMEMLGHPIVPPEITVRYCEHLSTSLPWDTFVPTLDILNSFLRCVRNNRSNISFVIYIMTQIDWQKVVVELEKESYAFDMLVDVLITFALSNDIFFKFGQDFISLFRKFKVLDLSLVSDEGFRSIMHRIDKTVQQGQHLQSLTNTGHLIQFMGSLCRFKHRDSSYVKHVTYFKHVTNIAAKISTPQYAETLVQSLLYDIEQVFYCTTSSDHVIQLCATVLAVFNKPVEDERTHVLAVKKIEVALKEKGSVKEGYSFSQLSLYYLSALTQHVTNVKVLALVCEILIDSYFLRCDSKVPVLTVSWNTLHERFILSIMSYDSFINHSVAEGCVLNLYLYTHHLLSSAREMDQKYSAVAMLLDTTARIVPKPKEEQKLLLLWFKIFDILIDLHNSGIRSSAISSIVKQLPTSMFKLAEDREASGIFGTSWFGKKSKFSMEFRMVARVIATYLLHQLNKDGSLRTTPNTRHNLSSEANKGMDNIRSLVNNKSYAAHIGTLQHCISMILDTTRTFLHIRDLVRFLATTYYDNKPYLSEIFYFKKT